MTKKEIDDLNETLGLKINRIEVKKIAEQSEKNFQIEKQKRWRDSHKFYTRQYNLEYSYGLSVQQFEQMLASQDGRCGICGEILKKPFVDHNHKTKKIRMLLCNGCNSGIGFFRENTLYLQRAIDYLNKFDRFEEISISSAK